MVYIVQFSDKGKNENSGKDVCIVANEHRNSDIVRKSQYWEKSLFKANFEELALWK